MVLLLQRSIPLKTVPPPRETLYSLVSVCALASCSERTLYRTKCKLELYTLHVAFSLPLFESYPERLYNPGFVGTDEVTTLVRSHVLISNLRVVYGIWTLLSPILFFCFLFTRFSWRLPARLTTRATCYSLSFAKRMRTLAGIGLSTSWAVSRQLQEVMKAWWRPKNTSMGMNAVNHLVFGLTLFRSQKFHPI